MGRSRARTKSSLDRDDACDALEPMHHDTEVRIGSGTKYGTAPVSLPTKPVPMSKTERTAAITELMTELNELLPSTCRSVGIHLQTSQAERNRVLDSSMSYHKLFLVFSFLLPLAIEFIKMLEGEHERLLELGSKGRQRRRGPASF